MPTSAADWLAFLSTRTAPLLLDDWEAADAESRRVLLALAHSRAGPPMIVSSRERSALGSGSGLSELSLRPLEAQDLGGDLYTRTGGLPALIEAVRQQRPRLEALSGLLAPLTPRARQLLACLTVQEQIDSRITGEALQLGPEALAEAHEQLQRAGWLSGHDLRATDALREWLAAQPSLEAEVLTLLAPQLSPADALPLYLRAQALTGSSELPGFQAALSASALSLLDAEQESEAEALLSVHARTPATWLLHARALDALGRGPGSPQAAARLAVDPRRSGGAQLGAVAHRPYRRSPPSRADGPVWRSGCPRTGAYGTGRSGAGSPELPAGQSRFLVGLWAVPAAG